MSSQDTQHDDPDATREVGEVVPRVGGSLEATRIGDFAVLRRLGAGGSGTVYSAYDERLDRRVAIKVLHGGASDPRGQRRILREAKAMARLSHPNVAHLYEVGEHEGMVYLVMEFVEGTTLAEWLRSERPWGEVLEVFRCAGRGLVAAHEAELVHRDFKPSNVMLRVEPELEVKVLDFGLARRRGTDAVSGSNEGPPEAEADADADADGSLLDSEVTEQGMAAGTPAYMSPEQLLGKSLDARTDQFSFCVALWEALEGTRPFSGKTQAERMQAVKRGCEHLPWSSKVPTRVRTALVRGLAYDPDDRWPGMTSLLDALEPASTGNRRWIWVAGLSAALVLGLSAWSLSSRPPSCASSSELAGWWTQERASLEEALDREGSELAAETRERVSSELDAWVDTWQEASVATCEEERSGRLPPSAAELRRACLENRSDQLRVLVEGLAGAEKVLELAVDTVSALKDPDDCRDVALLLERHPRPDDPVLAASVDELRRGLDRMAVEVALGGLRSEEVATLIDRAQRLGYGPVLAEAKELEARSLVGDLKLEEAIVLRRELLGMALADGHYWLAAQVAQGLAGSLLELARLDEAQLALGWARGLAQSTKAPELRVVVTYEEAELAQQMGRYEEAQRLFLEAVELGDALEVVPSVPHTRYAWFLMHRHRPAEALGQFERARQIRIERYGAHHPATAKTLSNLAAVRAELGAFEEAKETYEEVASIMEAYYGPEHPNTFVPKYELARMAERRGEYDKALSGYRNAVATVRKLGPTHQWVVLATKAQVITLRELERYDEASELLAAYRKRLGGDTTADLNAQLWALQLEFDLLRGAPMPWDELQSVCGVEGVSRDATRGCWGSAGHILLLRGELRDAERALRQVLALAQEDETLGSPLAWPRLDLAEALLRQGKSEHALRELETIESTDDLPWYDEGRFPWVHAQALLAEKRSEEAGELGEKAHSTYIAHGQREKAREVRAWLDALGQ